MKSKKIFFACAVVFSIFMASCAFAAEPIRIGVLVPLTGSLAGPGIDGRDGIIMAFNEIGNEISGRPVELFIEDSGADPNLAIQRVQRMVERDGIQLILGPLSGGEGMAVKDFADRIPDTTVIVAGAAAENITMRGVMPNVFRSSYSGAQVKFIFGEYAYDTLGIRRIVTLGEHYDFPFSQVGGFLSTFIRRGGEVLDRQWVSLGTSDFSSVIARIPTDIDAIFVQLGGTNSINFFTQFDEFGLRGRLIVLGGSTAVDTTVLQSAAGPLLEGVYSGSHYSQVLPFPEFKAFDESFMEAHGRPSSLFAADYYTAARIAIEVLKSIDGNIEDQQAFRDGILKTTINAPRGPIRFDEFHNVVQNVYINRVENVDGVFRNVAIETFEDQDQFGPFDPEWYQSQPSFDRINPTVETIAGAVLRQ